MKIAIPTETREHETRVAASPQMIKKLVDMGVEVTVQAGAGAGSAMTDAALKEAGASIADGPEATLKSADLVLKVASGPYGSARITRGSHAK